MLRVVLVDDQRPTLEILAHKLNELPEVEIVGKFLKPSEALASLEKLKADAVFLDIEMPEMNGIECAMKITEQYEDMAIIFVTAHDSFTLEAFDLNALHYILKPVDTKKLEESIQRIYKQKTLLREKAPQSPKPIRIRMLGGFEVLNGDKGSIRWITAKAEELFVYLLLHELEVSKWALMDSLWPNTKLQKAEQNLYTTIFRLRQTFKEHGLDFKLEAVQKTYVLTLPEDIDWDVKKLLCALNCKNKESLQKALSFYRGELLAGKDYFWCYQKRQEISNSYHEIALNLARVYFSEGRYREGLDVAEKVMRYTPLREEFVEWLDALQKLKLDQRLKRRVHKLLSNFIAEGSLD